MRQFESGFLILSKSDDDYIKTIFVPIITDALARFTMNSNSIRECFSKKIQNACTFECLQRDNLI